MSDPTGSPPNVFAPSLLPPNVVQAPAPPEPAPPKHTIPRWIITAIGLTVGIVAAVIVTRWLLDQAGGSSTDAGRTPQATADALEQAMHSRDGKALCALFTDEQQLQMAGNPNFTCVEVADQQMDHVHDTYEGVRGFDVFSVEDGGQQARARYRWGALESELQLVRSDGVWLVGDGVHILRELGGYRADWIDQVCSDELERLSAAVDAYEAETGTYPGSIEDLVRIGVLEQERTLGHFIADDGTVGGTCPG